MARIPADGYNDEALTIPATDVREFISGADFDGEEMVFWLRHLTIANEHATETATVEVYDQNEAVATAANQRLTLLCPPNATTIFEWPWPGVAFHTNICGATTLGTINAYGVHAGGGKG